MARPVVHRSMRNAVVAVALAAVVICGLGAGYLVGSTQRVTATTTVTITTTTISVPSGQFELAFRQTALCPNLGFVAPWKVALSNGESISFPTHANFSSPAALTFSQSFPSTFTFYVTDGTYGFSVMPANVFRPATGNVTVDNQDVVVTLGQELFSCGSTTAG